MNMFLKVALECFLIAMAITSIIFMVVLLMTVWQARKEIKEGTTKDIHCLCLRCYFWDEDEKVCKYLNMPTEDNREE